MYIPDIREGEARGRLRNLYHNLKATLHIPFVPDLFRSLAHYPAFLNYALEVSRPNLHALLFEELADDLRTLVPPETFPPLALPIPATSRDLRGAGTLLSVFRYGGAKMLLLTSAWYEALSERPITGRPGEEIAYLPPGIPKLFPRHVPIIRYDTAEKPLQLLLKQIADTHQDFAPADLHLALARYPTFLFSSWQQVRPQIGSPWHQEACSQLLQRAQTLAHALPYPLPLSPHRLQKRLSERELASCIGLIAAYRAQLPARLLDVELMSRMLGP